MTSQFRSDHMNLRRHSSVQTTRTDDVTISALSTGIDDVIAFRRFETAYHRSLSSYDRPIRVSSAPCDSDRSPPHPVNPTSGSVARSLGLGSLGIDARQGVKDGAPSEGVEGIFRSYPGGGRVRSDLWVCPTQPFHVTETLARDPTGEGLRGWVSRSLRGTRSEARGGEEGGWTGPKRGS